MKTYEIRIWKKSDPTQSTTRNDVTGVSVTQNLVTGESTFAVLLETVSVLEFDSNEYDARIIREVNA